RFGPELPKQMAGAGADPLVVQAFGSAGGAAGNALGQLTGTGDLGQQILAGTTEPFRPLVQAQLDAIVGGIHDAFAIATASVSWVGVIAAVTAAVFVLFLREAPTRDAAEVETEATDRAGSSSGGAAAPGG